MLLIYPKAEKMRNLIVLTMADAYFLLSCSYIRQVTMVCPIAFVDWGKVLIVKITTETMTVLCLAE